MKLSRRKLKGLIERLVSYNSLALVLLFITMIGVTSGFQISQESSVNRLRCGRNTAGIVEIYGQHSSFVVGQNYEKVLKVTNSASIPCYVRVFAEVEDAYVRQQLDIEKNGNGWSTKQPDGYYYYQTPLRPGESTTPLFSTINAKETVTDFRMICYSETVQSEGFHNADEAFKAIK